MTDKELADKVIALGVGNNTHDLYAFDAYHVIGCTFTDFVLDWRVAGALMEKVHHIQKTTNSWDQTVIIAAPERPGKDRIYIVVEESTTRAITEACVEALS